LNLAVEKAEYSCLTGYKKSLFGMVVLGKVYFALAKWLRITEATFSVDGF